MISANLENYDATLTFVLLHSQCFYFLDDKLSCAALECIDPKYRRWTAINHECD